MIKVVAFVKTSREVRWWTEREGDTIEFNPSFRSIAVYVYVYFHGASPSACNDTDTNSTEVSNAIEKLIQEWIDPTYK